MENKIAILGAGLVGTSWATIFFQAGYNVLIFDCDEKKLRLGISNVTKNLVDLKKYGLVSEQSNQTGKIDITTSLSDALQGAFYAQESIYEDLETKTNFYLEIDSVIDSNTIVGSSTSTLVASAFTENNRCSARCLVVHPANPPHLIPIVEIVPKPSTPKDVCYRVKNLMSKIGMEPIVLSHEIDGFILNRLQGALLNEAFYLFENGFASADDIDKTISKGLGLRWALMGPFETIDLNAPDGISDYCIRYSELYFNMMKQSDPPIPWNQNTIEKLSDAMRSKYASGDIKNRQAIRDHRLAALKAYLINE